MALKNIIGGTFESIGETAGKAAKVAPDVLGGMIEQGLKGQATPSDTNQKKTSSTADPQYREKVAEHEEKDSADLEKTRLALSLSRQWQKTPEKKPPTREQIAAYQEQQKKEKKAKETRHLKPIEEPHTKPAIGLSPKKIKGSEGLVKDVRTG